jgi:hypothetical protein
VGITGLYVLFAELTKREFYRRSNGAHPVTVASTLARGTTSANPAI